MAAGGPTIAIAAGGTGGHIFPGLALGEALLRVAPDASVSFVGTARGLEGDLVPKAGFPLDLVDMVPFAGSGRALLPFALVRSSAQARRLLRRRRADVAVGMGGYASMPLIAGARMAGIPSVIHESGAVPGKANLLAARVTGNVATAFEEAGAHFPSRCDVRFVGMPLPSSLLAFDRAALRAEGRDAYGLADGTTMVLVSGGSQGAASLNALALGLADRWRDRDDVTIVLKPGGRHHEAVEASLAGHPGAPRITLTRFIDRMDLAYAAADVAVMRAGAGTVAELAVVGLPAVLVPYPHAPSDHQTRNASALVRAGGALLVADADASADVVGPLLEARMDEPGGLDAMRAGMAVAARPRAADDLATWVLELAGSR
jgi:UDP-N-acetylglucosamine--N-acetylmuramyl-(pentapeptide) pyrophosphoryl-undecaprenol N-acetylglucosamine transferase